MQKLYIYFHRISGSIIITAKLNDKSDKFNSGFSYNYDTATYLAKI